MLAALLGATQLSAGEVPEAVTQRRLVIAFASHRERPAFANLYFYRHDGVGKGEIAGSIPALFERADSHPSLTSDGAVCAYVSKQVGGFTPLVNFWNRHEGRAAAGPAFNADAGARIEPCVSGDRKLLAFCARGQAGSMGGWDVQLFNTSAGRIARVEFRTGRARSHLQPRRALAGVRDEPGRQLRSARRGSVRRWLVGHRAL